MHKNVFTLPVSFIGSYIEDEPGFPSGKIIYVYRKRVSGVDKVVNLKDFSRPNKAIKCFKDLNRIQGLFKTTTKIQDLFKTVRTMLPKNPIPKQPS